MYKDPADLQRGSCRFDSPVRLRDCPSFDKSLAIDVHAIGNLSEHFDV